MSVEGGNGSGIAVTPPSIVVRVAWPELLLQRAVCTLRMLRATARWTAPYLWRAVVEAPELKQRERAGDDIIDAYVCVLMRARRQGLPSYNATP